MLKIENYKINKRYYSLNESEFNCNQDNLKTETDNKYKKQAGWKDTSNYVVKKLNNKDKSEDIEKKDLNPIILEPFFSPPLYFGFLWGFSLSSLIVIIFFTIYYLKVHCNYVFF